MQASLQAGAASGRALDFGAWSCEALGLHAGWAALPGSQAARQGAVVSARLAAGLPLDTPATLLAGECFASQGPLSPDALDEQARRHASDPAAFVAGLNGLFSGLQLDPARSEVRLFNDRYGAERLYLHETADTLYFASEAKALLAVLPACRHLDPAGLADFLDLGSVQGNRTLFRGISLLPGGSLWRVTPQAPVRRQRYFDPAQWAAAEPLPAAEFEQAFDAVLAARVPACFGQDERIGISLTGGLDTRMIMAVLPQRAVAPACYTYAGLDGETRDVTIARHISRELGLAHHVLRLDAGFLRDFRGHLDRTVHTTDGCAGASTAHELPLSAQAAGIAPIRLTGNFGSEVLRGMSTRKRFALPPGWLEPGAAAELAATRQAVQVDAPSQHPVSRAAFEEIPWHLFGPMAAARQHLSFRTPYLDNDLVALAHRAPEDLQRSADPALRFIARHHTGLARRPTDRAQCLAPGPLHPLARAWAELTFKLDYYHSEGLPPRLRALAPVMRAVRGTPLLGQHKFLNYREWFAGPLAGLVRDTLLGAASHHLALWEPAAMRQMIDQHIAGRGSFTREIHLALTLESLQRQFCGPGAEAFTFRTEAPAPGTGPAMQTQPHGA